MEEQQNELPPSDVSLRDWSDLITVCLLNIFQRLSLSDRLFTAVRVCKSWMNAARDGSLYASCDLESELKCGWLPPPHAGWFPLEFERRVDGMMRLVVQLSDGGLKEIRVRDCSDQALCFLAERSPSLRILSVRGSQSVTDESIEKISKSCPNLIELDISNCKEVTYRSMALIGKRCPDLKILKRNFSHSRPRNGGADLEAISIARFMHKLKHLGFQFCNPSLFGFKAIAASCNYLEFLDLDGFLYGRRREFEQALASLKNLETIVMPFAFVY